MSHEAHGSGLVTLSSPEEPAGGGWFVLVRASRLPGWARQARWAVAVLLAWLGLAVAATLLSVAAGRQGPPCLFRWLTTIPCPTCGTGRGAALLLSGDPLGALAHNPLVFSVLFLGGALLLVRLFLARRVALGRRCTQGSRGLWLTGAGLVLGNWAYLVLAGI